MRRATFAECLSAIAFWRREQWTAASPEAERIALRIRSYWTAYAVRQRRAR